MKLIVGLGNPGIKFQNTRHNLGFLFIDHLINKLKIEKSHKDSKSLYFISEYKGQHFILLKPQTYMNNSGESVNDIIKSFQIIKKNLIIIYDDISLPLADIRYRKKSSYTSHNGMKNIIYHLKTNNLQRLKIGIGYDPHFSLNEWVIKSFSEEEKDKIEQTVEKVLVDFLCWIEDKISFEQLMNKFNKKKDIKRV